MVHCQGTILRHFDQAKDAGCEIFSSPHAGPIDTVRTLRHPEVLERSKGLEGVFTFDLAQDGRE